jgi:hypothetical protein
MKKRDLATADLATAAHALTDEAFNGGIHAAICQGLADLDPFIGNYAPVFFTYTFYGHLNTAQMYAVKLFDTHPDAFTVSKFLQMAQLQSGAFKFAPKVQVLTAVSEAERDVRKLNSTLRVLRHNRNKFLAHISRELVFDRKGLQQAARLTIPQINQVLYAGGEIVNRFFADVE